MIKNKIRVGFLTSMATVSIIVSQISSVDAVKFHITPDNIDVERYAGASVRLQVATAGPIPPKGITSAIHLHPENTPWIFDLQGTDHVGIVGVTVTNDSVDRPLHAYFGHFFGIEDKDVFMTLKNNVLHHPPF